MRVECEKNCLDDILLLKYIISVCLFVCMYICAHTRVCICVFVCMCMCTQMRVRVCVFAPASGCILTSLSTCWDVSYFFNKFAYIFTGRRYAIPRFMNNKFQLSFLLLKYFLINWILIQNVCLNFIQYETNEKRFLYFP